MPQRCRPLAVAIASPGCARSRLDKKRSAGARLDLMSGIGAQRRRIDTPALPRYFDGIAAVRRGKEPTKAHGVAVNARMPGDRRAARAAKRGEKSAFDSERDVRVRIIDGGGKPTRLLVIGAGLDRDGALADGRQEFLDVERGGGTRKKSESL